MLMENKRHFMGIGRGIFKMCTNFWARPNLGKKGKWSIMGIVGWLILQGRCWRIGKYWRK